jgi:putative aldouronate transport system substrate-binding protein
MFAGIEGVDYDMADGAIQLREDIKLGDKYPFYKSGASCLALWNPDSWDIVFPSASPKEWLELNVARHNDAVNNGTLPKYYDAVLFLSTPLKDAFAWNAKDDLIQVMQGTEPVDKMISDLLAGYESKGYSAMIKEVNEAAAAAGIQP